MKCPIAQMEIFGKDYKQNKSLCGCWCGKRLELQMSYGRRMPMGMDRITESFIFY